MPFRAIDISEDDTGCRITGRYDERIAVFILPHQAIVDGLGKYYNAEMSDRANLLSNRKHVEMACVIAYNRRRLRSEQSESEAEIPLVTMTAADLL